MEYSFVPIELREAIMVTFGDALEMHSHSFRTSAGLPFYQVRLWHTLKMCCRLVCRAWRIHAQRLLEQHHCLLYAPPRCHLSAFQLVHIRYSFASPRCNPMRRTASQQTKRTDVGASIIIMIMQAR
ncbi:hypothetical protein C2E23DRAFT_545925 [Lenzites betulinus]|nr:hypothetical protein C2E23DRAFT_545925 [Lenzites betulinus]